MASPRPHSVSTACFSACLLSNLSTTSVGFLTTWRSPTCISGIWAPSLRKRPIFSWGQPLTAYLFQEDDRSSASEKQSPHLLNATVNGVNFSRDSRGVDKNERDIAGAGTLGDIMARPADQQWYQSPSRDSSRVTPTSTVIDGLVTKEGGELNARFPGCNFTPMERIALTANGTLQRIFSSYYDAPVHVHVDSCARRNISHIGPNDTNGLRSRKYESQDAVWDRVVHICVHGQVSN